jgi:predicted GNAT family acetyltransferase
MDLIARLQTYYHMSAANQGNENILMVCPLSNDQPTMTQLSTSIMICTPAMIASIENESGINFIVLSSQSSLEDVRVSLDTNASGFDPDAARTTDADAVAFRADLVTNRAITAMFNGRPVAAGMFTPPIEGIAELVGISTLVPYRGRGIGAVLTSELARIAFTRGVDTVFLQTDNPIAYRVYQRVGFQPVASLIVEGDQEVAA